MHHNSVGEIHSDDGYVYRDGVKLRKWFSNISGYQRRKYFWHPCLKEIAKIENLYHKLSARRTFSWERMEEIFEQVTQVSTPILRYHEQTWIAHAKPTHLYEPGEKSYWIFYLYKQYIGGKKQFTFNFDWVVEPEVKILPELGQEMYRANRYNTTCHSRAGIIHLFLLEAIKQHIKSRYGSHTNERRVFQYLINGRMYWLHETSDNQYSTPTLDWMPVQGIVSEII